MKKNEKGFRQEEKNLEKVAGGVGSVVDDVEVGDISLVNVNKTTDNSTNDSGNYVGYKDLSVRGKDASISVGGDLNFY